MMLNVGYLLTPIYVLGGFAITNDSYQKATRGFSSLLPMKVFAKDEVQRN